MKIMSHIKIAKKRRESQNNLHLGAIQIIRDILEEKEGVLFKYYFNALGSKKSCCLTARQGFKR